MFVELPVHNEENNLWFNTDHIISIQPCLHQDPQGKLHHYTELYVTVSGVNIGSRSCGSPSNPTHIPGYAVVALQSPVIIPLSIDTVMAQISPRVACQALDDGQ